MKHARNLIFTSIIITAITLNAGAADVTITKSGAAVSFFNPYYEAHDLSSNYTRGIVLGHGNEESKAVYQFYIPGDGTSNPLVTSITVNIYGSGTITTLAVGATNIIGSVSGNYSKTISGDDLTVGTYHDAVNGDVFSVHIDVLGSGLFNNDRYDLEKIELTYTYPGADFKALENYHTAYSGYNGVHGFRTKIVDRTWRIDSYASEEVLKAAIRETGSLCQNLLDLDGSSNAREASDAFFGALENFYNFVDQIYEGWEWLDFWTDYPITNGRIISEVKTACNAAATACANLAIAYQGAFDGVDTASEATTILSAIIEAESKLNTLETNLHSAAKHMHNVYITGNNQAKVAKQSMKPLMNYNPENLTHVDSYLPNLILDVQKMKDDFVQFTLNTYPSNKGLAVKADGAEYKNSANIVWPIGRSIVIEASSYQTGTDGKTYSFQNWSDGGSRVHTITPTSGATYTARFGSTPNGPSVLSHSSKNSNSITWTWRDNSSDETGFRGHDNSNNTTWTTSANSTNRTESGLSPNTQYTRHVHAYNQYGDSQPSNSHSTYTLAKSPSPASFSNITTHSIQANWTANGNPAGTEFYCENITRGTNSGWTTQTSWNSTDLASGTSYTFRVRARNAQGQETATTNLGSIMTQYDPVLDSITPASGPVGSFIKIDGQYFYDYNCCVQFTGGTTGQISEWTDSVIYSRVPSGTVSGDVTVYTSSQSNPQPFTITDPNVIYVDPSNVSHMENGTTQYPFSTIQRALDAANSGDEIIIPSGTYIEDISAGPGITIHFLGDTTVDGQATMGSGSNIVSDGSLTITGRAELGGDVIATNNLTFQSSVTADGSNQILDAGPGTLLAMDTITKTSAGDLTLVGSTLIDLNGSVDVQNGSLIINDAFQTTSNLIASGNVTMHGHGILHGGPQLVEARSGVLWAKSYLAKTNYGALFLASDTHIDIDGNITSDRKIFLEGNVTAAPGIMLKANNVGGSVLLTDQWTLTGEGALTIEADDDIILGGDVTAHGKLTLSADMNKDLIGIVQTQANLITTLGDIEISEISEAVDFDGDVVSAGNLVLVNDCVVAPGRTLSAANDFTLQSGNTLVGEGELNILAGGNIVLSGESTIAGHFSITADNDANGLGNVLIEAPVTLTDGSFTSSGIDFSDPNAIISTSGDNIAINHTGLVILGADLNPNGGVLDGTATNVVVTPLGQIQDGIDISLVGGRSNVTVQPGIYYENINFDYKNVTLTSINPNNPNLVAETIIDGSQNDAPAVTFPGAAFTFSSMSTLLTNLEYPRGLWVKQNVVYLTETAGRNSPFGGKVSLDKYDVATEEKTVLINNPQNVDAVVVANDDLIYLTSRDGTISVVDPGTNIETHLLDIPGTDMFIDAEDNILVLDMSQHPYYNKIHLLSVGDYLNPTIIINYWSVNPILCISKRGSDVYFSFENFLQYFTPPVTNWFTQVVSSLASSITFGSKYLYYADNDEWIIKRADMDNNFSKEPITSVLNGPCIVRFDESTKQLYILEQGTSEAEFKDGTLKVIDTTVDYPDGVLNGFTIQNANQSGIHCISGGPVITNCTLIDNSATSGGGIRNYGNPKIVDCTFVNNYSSGHGGAVYSRGAPNISNCVFISNTSNNRGGALNFSSVTMSSPVANCLFVGNYAGQEGGAIYYNGSNLKIINSTIANNYAGEEGGAITCSSSSISINNSILYDNDALIGKEIYARNNGSGGNSTLNIDYTNIHGGQASVHVMPGSTVNWGDGNIKIDPLFASEGYWDFGDWIDGDYHLQIDSLCIDAGDPNYVTDANDLDLDGNRRVYGGRVDIGAYEYQPERHFDWNNDGIVNFGDFSIFAYYWVDYECVWPDWCESADSDESGLVDYNDLIAFFEKWLVEYPVVFYSEPFDANPHWSTTGQWSFGQPIGGGGTQYGNPDPTTGHTGNDVYSVNLRGDYDETTLGTYYLTSELIDCSGHDNIKLKFARWLNTDDPDYVKSKVEVSNDGTNWNLVWEHDRRPAITDDRWRMLEYDISGTADAHETVYIRWGYEILENAYPYSGWNIDDIQLWGNKITE